MNWIKELAQSADQWIGGDLSIWLTILGTSSFCMFVGSILATLAIINVLPDDYFLHWHHKKARPAELSILHVMVKVLKNLLGFTVLMAGIAMLFLPGQGLLTILIALMLLDFPYKRQILDRIIQQEKIRNSLNWIRKKRRRPPFHFADQKAERQQKCKRQVAKVSLDDC